MKGARVLAVATVLIAGCRGIIGLGPTSLEEDDAAVDSGLSADGEGAADSAGPSPETGPDSGADTAHDTGVPDDTSLDSMVEPRDVTTEAPEDAKREAEASAVDSGAAHETSVPIDSSPAIDAAIADSSLDSAAADTSIADSSVVDSAPVDSTIRDTGSTPDGVAAATACDKGPGGGACIACCRGLDPDAAAAVESADIAASCLCNFSTAMGSAMPCSTCNMPTACSLDEVDAGSPCDPCLVASLTYCANVNPMSFLSKVQSIVGGSVFLNCVTGCAPPMSD